MDKDYYRILQVDPSADSDVIKAAYKKLAKKYHPDINNSSDATERMRDINEAYAVLRSPSKRARYNRMRSAGTDAPPSAPAPPRPAADEDRRRRQQAEAARQRAEQQTAEERLRVEALLRIQRLVFHRIAVGLIAIFLLGVLGLWIKSSLLAAVPPTLQLPEATPTTIATAYPSLMLNPTSFPSSYNQPDVTQQIDIQAISMVASKNLLVVLVDKAIKLYSRGDRGWDFQHQIAFPRSYRAQRRIAMALEDQTLAIAFSMDFNDQEDKRNIVYIFSQEPDGTWVQTQTLEDNNYRSALGAALLIKDGSLYVGTIGDPDNLAIYKRQGDQWVVKQFIDPDKHYHYDGGFNQGSRQFFDVSGSILVVGQVRYESRYGKIVIYQKSPDGNWAPKQTVGPFGDTAGFGVHTRVEGSTLVSSILDDQFVVFNDLSADATWSYYEPTVLNPSEHRFITDVSLSQDYFAFATGVKVSLGADRIFVFRRAKAKWDIAYVIDNVTKPQSDLILKMQLVDKTLYVLTRRELQIFDLP